MGRNLSEGVDEIRVQYIHRMFGWLGSSMYWTSQLLFV